MDGLCARTARMVAERLSTHHARHECVEFDDDPFFEPSSWQFAVFEALYTKWDDEAGRTEIPHTKWVPVDKEGLAD